MNGGKLNIRINRTRNYLSLITFIQVTYLTITTTNISYWILCAIVGFVLIVNFIDLKYVYKNEVEHNLTRSESFKQLVNDTREIREILTNKKDKDDKV